MASKNQINQLPITNIFANTGYLLFIVSLCAV